MGIIYKTTNLLNGMIYVGQHFTSANGGYLGSGTYLKIVIKKHGRQNFKRETLEHCEILEMNNRETYWINCLSATNREIGYNLMERGGYYDSTGKNKGAGGRIVTEEIRQKIRENTDSQRIMIDNKEYVSITESSRKLKIERCTIQRRLKNDNYPNYQYINGSVSIVNGTGYNITVYDKRHLKPEEARKKLSIERMGSLNPNWKNISSEETREKQREKTGTRISIDNQIYSSLRQASKQTGIERGMITRRMKNPNFPNYTYVKKK
jgi:hypothetical protein